MKISEYVKSFRKQTGLTQNEFAEAIRTNRSAIANYENGRVIPPGNVLLRIQAFELSLDSPPKSKLHITFLHKLKNLFSRRPYA